jgi:alpha-N-arabinofuranosidase
LSGVVLLFQAIATSGLVAREFEVSVQGSDADDGSAAHPLRTISAAARLAQPGDTITVHAGIYRERIDPPRGGTSDGRRIVYQAAAGEKVEIAGSEEVKSWVKVQGDVWKATLPNSFFGGFNPYSDRIHGDWFQTTSKQRHTGMVYLNGDWMLEAATLDDVMDAKATAPFFFAGVGRDETTIWARFKGVDPNRQRVEINVRQTVFYPSRTGIDYLTVRGFTLRDAATPWAPPTTEQVGLIGTNWSKGWIIENNVVTHSTCSGISLGKYGDAWDDQRNGSGGGYQRYLETVQRAESRGWDGNHIGHHIVRNNIVCYCDQAGINGSLGAIFSEVTGNDIYEIANRGQIQGAEVAGIKFHGAVDVLIAHNRIHNTRLGMWMDWMAQGTRITGNLFYRNGEDLMMEVDHGPYLVDNNLFLSRATLLDVSEGGAYVNNLIAGTMRNNSDKRSTPYFKAHSTVIAGDHDLGGGDDRFFNNLFVGDGKAADARSRPVDGKPTHLIGYGLSVYDTRKFPLETVGNVYFNEALPYAREAGAVKAPGDLGIKVVEHGGHVELQLDPGSAVTRAKTRLATTALLGTTRVSQLGFENPDGSPLRVDTDYFGEARNGKHPTAGPFENLKASPQTIEVW